MPPSITSRFGGYANRFPARAFVALVEVAPEPPAQHLLHRGEVVLALVLDLEVPVVRPLRQPVLEHGHRRDDLGALQVRDVEALDAQRRLGEVQRLLERDQRPRRALWSEARLSLCRPNASCALQRHRLEQRALLAPLRHADADLGPLAGQRQELLVELALLRLDGHEHLARHVLGGRVAVELLEDPRDQLGRVDVLDLVDDETLAAVTRPRRT